MVVVAATSGNDVHSLLFQSRGQKTAAETKAVVGAHNNQPRNDSNGVIDFE